MALDEAKGGDFFYGTGDDFEYTTGKEFRTSKEHYKIPSYIWASTAKDTQTGWSPGSLCKNRDVKVNYDDCWKAMQVLINDCKRTPISWNIGLYLNGLILGNTDTQTKKTGGSYGISCQRYYLRLSLTDLMVLKPYAIRVSRKMREWKAVHMRHWVRFA